MQLALLSLLVGSSAAISVLAPARATIFHGAARPTMAMGAAGPVTDQIWATSPSVAVQGNTLKTWDIGEKTTERVQLSIRSGGRPVDANIELWHTPSYIPTQFRVYTEDGQVRPVTAIIETPKHPKTVAVYNTGSMEFPFDANVANTGLGPAYASLSDVTPEMIQGGRITSYNFGPEVNSVQILLKSDERNLKAKIELTQGPNQVKQLIEVYASSGYKNPFYCIIQTPGGDNTLRVINQNNVEFPFDAWVLPCETGLSSGPTPFMGSSGWA